MRWRGRSCGSGRCPRPERPCRDRTWPARRPAAAAEASSKGLVDVAAKPALQARGVGGLQEGLGAMTLQTQSLQGLPLAVEGLVDGHDVVRLGRGGVDGRAAESAEPLLLQQQLPQVARVPARLQERSEDLAGGRGEALAPYRHSTKPRMATWGWCPCPAALPGPRAGPGTRSARARSPRATPSSPGRGARWTRGARPGSWAGPAVPHHRKPRRRRCGRRRRDRGRCSRPRAAFQKTLFGATHSIFERTCSKIRSKTLDLECIVLV